MHENYISVQITAKQTTKHEEEAKRHELYLQRFLGEVSWVFPTQALGTWLGLDRARRCKEGLGGSRGSKEEEGGRIKQAKGVKNLELSSHL